MTTELINLLERKADGDDKAPPEQHTGAMIALRPRQDHIDRIALQEGEPPQELHTTILFLGKAADYSYEQRDRIIEAMRQVALRYRFVTAKGFGVNYWNADTDEPCIVLACGGSELVDIRNAIVEALMGFDLLQMPEQHEPWVPHVTLAYTDDGSQVQDLAEDLTGEIVFDAIRVAFGGIVDDIPLQAAAAANDGVAGVPGQNRYAQVLSTVKSFRTPRIPIEEKKTDLGNCRYCKNKAQHKVGIDGGAWIGACGEHLDKAKRDADGEGLEEKGVRHVRTAGGVKRYGQPIGSVIVGDGKSPLKNLKEQRSEYEGFNKYKARGKTYYTHKNGGRYEALDENDKVLASNASEEGLLKDLDSGKLSSSTGHVGLPSKAKNADDVPDGYEKADSEYDGYDKFVGRYGIPVYRDQATGKFYDENDNEVSDISTLGEPDKAARKTTSDPGGLKKVESEYDGYDKFIGQNGKPIYRDNATDKFYDADDNEVDVNDYNGEKVKADLTKKKPVVADVTPARTSSVSDSARKRAEKMIADREKQRAAKDGDDGGQGDTQKTPAKAPERDAKPSGGQARRSGGGKPPEARTAGTSGAPTPARGNQPGGDADDTRNGLYSDQLNGADDVNAVLDKVKNSRGKVAPSTIQELRDVALRQSDVRNRRKLMLYAQQLAEEKAFLSLVEMDPMLRAMTLEVKLITPGGRVGSGASLSRSPKKNWIERSKFGRLPKYIRIVANGLKKNGHDTSRAIALAVAAVKRWARGGDNVRPQVQAAAAKAVAEWEALKAAA